MEMIIVFPLYLVLFGGMFMVGDMMINTTRLASADRVRALDLAKPSGLPNGWGYVSAPSDNNAPEGLFDSSRRNAERQSIDNLSAQTYTRYANGSFRCPWYFCAGATVTDNYRQTSWTRGWLRYVKNFLDTAVDGQKTLSNGLIENDQNPLYSKHSPGASGERTYNYYTYRRAKDYSGAQLKRRYRAMPSSLEEAGRLVDAAGTAGAWYVFVKDEPKPAIDDPKGNQQISRNSSSPTLYERKYERYPQFVTWSD